ncbi:MAG: PD40 domain-containing protein, partial [Pyrinomonadaceae bacterium]|nr:PD40 domain-containing protein [Phycisphaerales bacterium]
MNRGRAHSNRAAAIIASAAATAALLSGCSMFSSGDVEATCKPEPVGVQGSTVAAPPAARSTTAHTTNASVEPVGSPSLNAYSLAESLENNQRPSRTSNDSIVNNVTAIPSSATPVGSVVQDMALDTMDSLAQVTFASQGSDFDPAVSRDGQFIVYASTQHRPTADIYMKSVNGRTITQLTADPGQDVMPTVSPDGKRVAFASNRSGSWDVYVMTSSGGQAVQVTSDPAHELHPSWSPDGTQLVFSRMGPTSGRWE